MSLLTKMKYSFESKGMDKEAFTVISFKGFEAISKPYKFEILLVSEKTDIDPLSVLQNPAVFTIHRDQEDDVTFNGILMQFEETQEFDGHLFFKAVLTPKFWWLSLTHHNQVFLDLSVPDIIEHALKDGGLNPGIDFSFNLMNSYQPLEYVCQYDESHFNFASRWAEREGMYYFFEQTPNGEKIIFTDSKMEHKDLLLGKDLIYLPQSGLDALHTKEVVQNFLCRHNMMPQKVFLKDYNYLKPSFSIEGIADVDENGRGENYVYGVHFDSPEEGNRLAQIRAEALICRKSVFHGESSVPFIIPGYTFDLNDHYKDAYNRKYLVSEVTHEGHQTGYLISGLSKALDQRDEAMFYSNSFTAIYSDEQFRAEHLSEKPKISGTINAKIDAAGSGEHAELDEHGRYKVILPFDRSGKSGGKASAFFRMMQPSAGQNQGMHFPLHKGTEVLLTFIDGNPDRPVIAGAMPNPETSSPVTDGNQTKSIISTGKSPVDQSVGAKQFGINEYGEWSEGESDNYIEFEDDLGSRRIRMASTGNLWFHAQGRYVELFTRSAHGNYPSEGTSIIQMMKKFGDWGGLISYNPTGMLDRHTGADQDDFYDEVYKEAHVHASSMDTVNTQEGNVYDFGGYWVYNLGNCYIENHMAQSNPGQKPHPPAPTDAEKDASPNAGLEAPDDQLTEIEVKHRDAVNKINTENPRQAKLNEDLDFDLLKGGGPNWNAGATHSDNWEPFYVTSVTTPPAAWDVQKGSKMELWDSDATDDSPTQWKKIHHSSGDGDEGWKNVWVEKKFGDSYEYTEGNSVSIVRGNSQEIIFDGREIVEKYKGDGSAKKYYYKSGSGRKEEKKWNHKTGKLVSDSLITISGDDGEVVETTIDKYERSSAGRQIGHTWTKEVGGKGKETVNNKYDYRTGASYSYSAEATDGTDFEKFSIGYQHKNIADFSFGDQQSFSLKGSPVDLTCNVNIGYAYSFNFKLAGTFNFELAAVDAITIKTGFCIGMDLDYRIGGFIKRDPADDYAFKTVGITLQKESVGKLKAAADLYADHGKVKIGKNTFLLSVLDTAKVDL